MDNTVYGLAPVGAAGLYATGYFLTAGSNSASQSAFWDGSAWHALGAGLDSGYPAVVVVAGSQAYFGGEFMIAGTHWARRVAAWDGAWHTLGTSNSVNDSPLALVSDGAGGMSSAASSREPALRAPGRSLGGPAQPGRRWPGGRPA
jgi:hypothetical protein